MSILYALIAKDFEVVWSEYTEYRGNFQQITRIWLRKIKANTKYTIEYDKYKYHYINEDNITYLCMSESFPEDWAFAFWSDVKAKFMETYDYDKIASFCAYQWSDFDKILHGLIGYYNSSPKKTKAGDVIKELIEAKNIAVENFEKIWGRDEKLAIIVTKSDNLNSQSNNIGILASQIKKRARMKQMKTLMLVGGSIVICVLWLFFMLF